MLQTIRDPGDLSKTIWAQVRAGSTPPQNHHQDENIGKLQSAIRQDNEFYFLQSKLRGT